MEETGQKRRRSSQGTPSGKHLQRGAHRKLEYKSHTRNWLAFIPAYPSSLVERDMEMNSQKPEAQGQSSKNKNCRCWLEKELRNEKRDVNTAKWEAADVTDPRFLDSILLLIKEIHVDFLVSYSMLALTILKINRCVIFILNSHLKA